MLDFRHNGGGLVAVARNRRADRRLALVGRVFVQFTHNDKQTSRDTAYRFESPGAALAVSRLVVIATRGSASASGEDVINGRVRTWTWS